MRSARRPSASTPDPHDCWRHGELNSNCGVWTNLSGKRGKERVPEIHNRGAEDPKAAQLFHNNPKDHSHMQHPQEEVLTVYGFSQAEHNACIYYNGGFNYKLLVAILKQKICDFVSSRYFDNAYN